MTDLLSPDPDLDDETDEERAARREIEGILDDISQMQVDQIVDRLLLVVDELSGLPLYGYQTPIARRIIESLIIGDGATITAIQARQSGKSEVVANTIATCMVMLPILAKVFPDLLGKFSRGLWVGCFAPTDDQAQIVYSRIITRLTSGRAEEMFSDPDISEKITKGHGNTMHLNNGSLVRRQTAHPRSNIEGRTYHLMLIDECFPAGTPVLTSEGWVPIDTIVNRPENHWRVASRTETGIVWANVITGYRTRRNNTLVRVDHEHGSLYATANHPFVVGREQVPAIHLRPGAPLSLVQGTAQPLDPHAEAVPTLRGHNLQQLTPGTPEERDVEPGHSGPRIEEAAGDGSSPTYPWGKWDRTHETAESVARRTGRRVGPRVCDPVWRRAEEGGPADALQVGSGEPPAADRRGGGRGQSRLDLSPGGGSAEGLVVGESRVVGVAVLEQGDPQFDQFSDRADYVYTLEVDHPSHTYVAAGVVVGNCQDADPRVINKSIGPMGASTNATMVFIGTPSYHKGAFYNTIAMNKRQGTKRGARQNHFEVDWKEVSKWNKNYEKFVRKEMLRIGEDSDEFRLSYRLHWLLDKGMFTTSERLEELGDKCLLPGAELLTEHGWRAVEDVSLGDVIATMNPDTRQAEWRPVSCVTAMDYDGPVLNYFGDVRLTVTANHRVYGSTQRNSGLRAWPAKDAPETIRLPQFATGFAPLGAPPSDVIFPAYRRRQPLTFTAVQWAGFLGQWLADGSLVCDSRSRNVAKITAIRPDKKARIRDLLTDAGIHWYTENHDRDTCVANKALVEHLLPLRGAANKRVSREWMEAGDDVLQALWHGVFTYGDGHWRDETQRSGTFRTVSKALADDVAEMSVRLGYRPMVQEYVNSAGNPSWCVSVLRRTTDSMQKHEWSHYAGPVYCVTVPPHHTMLARQEGSVCWTGNSMEIVHSWFKTPVVVGIDPARKQDSTIVTVVWVDWDHPDEFGFYEHRILNWLDLSGLGWEEQYARIVDFLANYHVYGIAVDEGGLGDPVISRLRVLMPHVEIMGVASDRSTQSKRWKHLKNLLDKGKIGWPAHAKTRRLKVWKRFAQQMEDLELKFEGPYVVAQAPKATDAHDDYADSLALACIVAMDYQTPSVEVSLSPFYS